MSYKALGDLKGTNFNYAEIEESTPAIVVWRDDGNLPAQRSIYIFEDGEGFRVNHANPAHHETITYEVARMNPAEIQRLGLVPPEV